MLVIRETNQKRDAASGFLRLIVTNRALPLVLVTCFSLLYFIGVFIRSSGKYFWFDELCTMYISRLPTFHDAWRAVINGADFNPPLFYVFERASRDVFGDGRLGMRLPSMLGFWSLCLCLYRFVSRRAGLTAGVVAMVLPCLTGAYYYAYEARPHSIVLGLCGLALVSWDAADEDVGRRGLWLTCFSGSLAAAFLTHCYALVIAIPFEIVELVYSLRFRTIRWSRWVAFFVPAVVAAVTFLPLVRSFGTNVAGTGFNQVFAPDFSQLSAFYISLFSPCILVLVCAFVLLGLNWRGPVESSATQSSRSLTKPFDVALTIAFLGIPLYGILLGKAGNGPFFARYFMAAVIGVSLAFGLATQSNRLGRSSTLVLCLIVSGTFLIQTCNICWQRYQGEEIVLREPSTDLLLNTTVGKPLANQSLLISAADNGTPIVVAYQLDFLYLVTYWPSALPRLYSVTTSTQDLQYHLYTAIRRWCHVPFNPPEVFDDFLRSHPDFVLYGNADYDYLIANLVNQGVELRSLRFGDDGHFLAQLHVRARDGAATKGSG